MNRTGMILSCFGVMFCGFFSLEVRGDVLKVPSGAYPTIQSAIDTAASGDIVLVASGIYMGVGQGESLKSRVES